MSYDFNFPNSQVFKIFQKLCFTTKSPVIDRNYQDLLSFRILIMIKYVKLLITSNNRILKHGRDGGLQKQEDERRQATKLAKKNCREVEGITQRVGQLNRMRGGELQNEGVISKFERKFKIKRKGADVVYEKV